MNRLLIFMFFVASGKAFAQYPFEKYKSPKIESYTFKMLEQDRHLIYTCDINNFYENQNSAKITVNGNLDEYEKTYIEIDSKKYFEAIPAQGVNDLFVGDFNGDGKKDIKLTVFYMGSGLASMRMRIIYFFQKQNQLFTKVAFDDMQDENAYRTERDINGDGNFEIITMSLTENKNHNYWTFNLYNLVDDDLVCVNRKLNYPIMIQFLYRENFKITNNLTRNQMKKFSAKQPDELTIEK